MLLSFNEIFRLYVNKSKIIESEIQWKSRVITR
jgi:hypothetical protein